MCQNAETLTIHAYGRDACRRHDLNAALRGRGKFLCGNGFHFGDDYIGIDLVEERIELLRISHIQNTVFVCNLRRRSSCIAVSSAYPCTQTHQLNRDFFAKLA
ncbi:hypothetical protein BITS_1838 [Bifidobacterium tsurumiense]|uniref:Uncharacterized protein n=1 Tax=Bifidobacterium tsurumiense TaxID=356829 RepID=A0A087EE21_9BIFI|nr:hypothetical protein BITS_1838 [Bifidobacterium tsurumiense]